MSSIKKISGIVIRKKDLLSGDKFFTVLTDRGFKIELTSKNISKSKNREIISTDLLSYSEFLYYPKSNIVKESFLIKRYFIKDLFKIRLSFYAAKLIFHISNTGVAMDLYFSSFIYLLDNIEREEPMKLLFNFLVEICKIEGIYYKELTFSNIEKHINNSLDLNLYFNNFMNYI